MEIPPNWDNKEFYPLDIKLSQEPPQKVVKANKPSQINKTLYFDYNQSTLTKKSKKAIEELVLFLVNKEITKATVIGFCDPKGENAYNQTLSENRAKIVGEVLQNKGFNIDSIHGRGEINNSQEDALNRKVEITIWIAR